MGRGGSNKARHDGVTVFFWGEGICFSHQDLESIGFYFLRVPSFFCTILGIMTGYLSSFLFLFDLVFTFYLSISCGFHFGVSVPV